jgi:hypothetical protein
MKRSGLLVLLLITSMAIYACGSDNASPTQSALPDGISPSAALSTTPSDVPAGDDTGDTPLLNAKKSASKVAVCHVKGNGSYHLINVSANAVSAHLAHGDLVGVDADENCGLGGGGNTAPVALSGPLVDGVAWVPAFPDDQPPAESGDLNLLASDADMDTLTFSQVGAFNPEGNDIIDFTFDEITGQWTVLCFGATGGHSSFQWKANDGQADSNIATQYFLCLI